MRYVPPPEWIRPIGKFGCEFVYVASADSALFPSTYVISF